MGQWLDMFDGQWQVQPPLDDSQLRQVPAKRGVLLLAAAEHEPIIMLSSADLRQRVAGRLRNPEEDPRRNLPDLRQVTRSIFWKLAGSHFETDLHFMELARAIWPQDYPSLLGWSKATFVHVEPSEKCPHFTRTNVLGRPGRYVGPFPPGQWAQRFIEAIEDAFGLCRDVRCLRQAPHGPRCSYGQMGRCVCPCDGTMPMDEYRQLMAAAADFAAGDRQAFLQQVQARMQEAAGRLEFEKAAALKARLGRLAELDKVEYRHVRPLEQFRFLLVQSGLNSRTARAFFADRGGVASLGQLDYPPQPLQLQQMLAKVPPAAASAVGGAVGQSGATGEAAQWTMGLVMHYLYCSPQRRGLIVRADDSLTAEMLAGQIEQSADLLHLKARKAKNAQ